MSIKKAFITGITGQDGSYLCELLLNLGYQVVGIVRDKTKVANIESIYKHVKLYEVDLSDFNELKSIILSIKPNLIYNLGGVTTLSAFDKDPIYSVKVTEEAAKLIFDLGNYLQKRGELIKIFQASSCLIFGSPSEVPQDEQTSCNPKSLYAKSKLNVDLYAQELRRRENLFISCGILYNHESPRRPLDFVTRKITVAAACIYNKVKKIPIDSFGNSIMTENYILKLTNLNAKRDWGDARDFVKAFLLMLEQKKAEDFVLATGKIHTIQNVLEVAFGTLGLDWRDHVIEDKKSLMVEESDILCGNAEKAKSRLGWIPKIPFEDTISDMVKNDIKIFSN